ncbi:MAG: hypothetical protein FJW26_01560 [Acidimicrobiia bacterium]|nr:hypothetical protein [Acidimicrobiia bacterium]
MTITFLAILIYFLGLASPVEAQQAALQGTRVLTLEGDLSLQMREGIDKFLLHELERSIEERQKLWKRDYSSLQAYQKSVEPNRARFRKYVGAVDHRLPVTALEYSSTTLVPAKVSEAESYAIYAIRWPVLEGVFGEGLLLQPKRRPLARVVAIPDADQTPEMLVGLAPGTGAENQFARRLVENGCQVVVPVLTDRKDTWSGNEKIWMTNQPHREWVYRQAYQMGRHVIGYEIQKVLGVVDWFVHDSAGVKSQILVAGYAEGGLLAFYSAALDTRIDAVLVSGYFDSRQQVWEEPIYRNVFGLLHEFGDAELAGLITPRRMIVEHSQVPTIDGPPKAREGRRDVAAPGKLQTPKLDSVRREVSRSISLFPQDSRSHESLKLIAREGAATVGPGSDEALKDLLHGPNATKMRLKPSGKLPIDLRKNFDPAVRQKRQLEELLAYTGSLLRRSGKVRQEFWNQAKPTSVIEWESTSQPYRDYLWDEVFGRFPKATIPANPRARPIADNAKWAGYEVVLDVYPGVIAWGILLVPKDIKDGERRPVVVCQHGLEGQPLDVITDDPKSRAFQVYKSFAARLAERGFVTFAPHNFYRGANAFRQMQRKANPLKKTLWAITAVQHERILDWLSTLPFVDPKRMGFYGLSYGGNTAVRVPTLLDRYAVVISSGDFNEWITKNVSVEDRYSFMFYGAYEVFEFNLGHTFNHGDLAGLIAPRPFMVERGHLDEVAPDEWVAAEYARVRRLYDWIGIPELTQIEFFNGPHTINGVETFEFLHKHLQWPKERP